MVKEIPKGYKKTEVGVIPEDWEVKKLGDIADIQRGASPRPIDSPMWYDSSSTIGWVRISDITASNGRILEYTKDYLSQRGVAVSRFLPKGSLIMSICATVGTPVITYIDACIHDGFVGFTKIRQAEQIFLYYKLKELEPAFKTMGQTGSQNNLNSELVRECKIHLPPLPEQKAIAQTLTDVDDLISSLEKTRDKYKAIKQGMMQQLLTGKKRLSGFTGEWKQISMRKDTYLKARIGWQALTTEEYLEDGSFFLVTGTDFLSGRVNWTSCHFVDEWRYNQDKNIQLRKEDVLLTKDGTIGKVGYIENIYQPATLNSGIFVIRPVSQSFHPLFLYYILSSAIFDNFLNKIFAGSTISHLYQKDFVTFNFFAPQIKEQKAIAQVLSDMDAEIDKLETTRDKYKAVKQGMMQELLTGKTRLVSNN